MLLLLVEGGKEHAVDEATEFFVVFLFEGQNLDDPHEDKIGVLLLEDLQDSGVGGEGVLLAMGLREH